MTEILGGKTSRRAVLGAFASIALIPAAPVYGKTIGYIKGAGKIRRIKMRSGRTGESIDMVYWIDGKYIRPALKEINYFMRDWREDAVANMDRRNFDLIAATHNLLDTSEPFQLLSGYRTQRTNNMLRSRSGGVARKSYHIRAMAADLRISSRSVGHVSKAAQACRAGGVGRYHGSNFTHVDCGPVRSWRG